jgi:phospholipid-binding lipoprotein MlaA
MRKALISSFFYFSISMVGFSAQAAEVLDPYENYNRGVYYFNKTLDKTLIKPLAFSYDRILPKPVKFGVRNFFSNIAQVPIIGNDFLQGEPKQGMKDIARLMINSTIGVLGLFDVAQYGGLNKHEADLGQTLAYWGYKDSAYFVLPLFGPSTVRDTIGRLGDFGMSAWAYLDKNQAWWELRGLEYLSLRAEFLAHEKVLDTASLDEYKFVRNAYLQRRKNLISTGNSGGDKETNDLEGPPA